MKVKNTVVFFLPHKIRQNCQAFRTDSVAHIMLKKILQKLTVRLDKKCVYCLHFQVKIYPNSLRS